MNFSDIGIIYTIIALLVAIIPHEVAHGYAAYVLGDDTAKTDGRLSFNPLNHIDPIGLMMMILIKFGWAKAVPINPEKFKGNKKVGTIIVSLAGVTANFIIAFIFAVMAVGFYKNNGNIHPLITEILWYNVMLGVFNLVPLPPLDGSKVLASFLPSDLEYKFYEYEKYLYIFLVLFLASGLINKIIAPIITTIMNLFINAGIGIWTII